MKANTDVAVSGESNVLLVSTNQLTLGGEVKVDEGHDPATIFSSYGAGSKTPFQWTESIKKLTESIRSITN